jgi:hypothetical protein
VLKKGDKMPSFEEFISFYDQFLGSLFEKNAFDCEQTKTMLSYAIASDDEFFFKKELPQDRYLLKPNRSVIQMQPLGLFVSSIDQAIHAKSYAKDTQSFGIKFSIALTYEDAKLHKIYRLDLEDSEYKAFNELRRFVRNKTIPLTIQHHGEKKVYPFRFSKDLKDKISDIEIFKKNSMIVL